MHSLGATNPATDLGNWTVAKLYDFVNAQANKARAEGARIRENTHAIAQLFTQANSLPAGTQKDATLAKLRALSSRQAKIILDYKSFTTRWASAMTTFSSWLKKVGLTPPSFALSDVGAAPAIVPIAIVAGIVAVVAYIATLAYNNANMARAVGEHRALLASYLDGKLTWSEYQEAADNVNDAEKAAAKAGGYGGFQGVLDAAMPVLILVGIILLLPQLTSTMRSLRAGRA